MDVWRDSRTVATMLRLMPAYLAFVLIGRWIPIERLARWAWQTGPAKRQPSLEARLVGCVVRLRQLLRVRDEDCIARSLLLYRELSRLGAAPTLCLGFRRRGAQLEGHAWVEVDGRSAGETPAEAAGFEKQLACSIRSPCCHP
jgi:hypothetical protein